jgi:cell division transport system permease protein
MWREQWNSALTILVIGVALALPTGLIALLANVQKINTHWDNGVQISVFFKKSVSETLLKDKQSIFQNYKAITQIQYISPKQALEEFEKTTGQTNLLKYLDENPLPPMLILYLKTKPTKQEIETIIKQIRTWPEVEKIQLDQTWLQRLHALLALADHAVTIVTIILAMTVFIITCNTIRLDIEKKKRHIIITKLVGATNAFVRREFLYFGFWYGFLGSIVAWIIVTISILILKSPVTQVAILYQSNFVLTGLDSKSTFMLFFLGTMLGISGAWIAVGRYLDQLTLE